MTTHWISALPIAALAAAIAGCSGGGHSSAPPPANSEATAAGVTSAAGPTEELPPTELVPQEEQVSGLGDEFNEAYVQLEAIRQPYAMPETFYESTAGAAVLNQALGQSETYVELGTSGTGYQMVGRDGALLQYGTPELVDTIRIAATEWDTIHPELPMHLRALSPQDITQHFVGNMFECVETYALGHIFARRVDTYADDGTPVEWVTEYSSDNNGVVWHHLGKEADFQEFTSGAMNQEMVSLIENVHQGTEPTRAYIFDVLAQDNDLIMNNSGALDAANNGGNASSVAGTDIASPLHIDFHGSESNFEDAGNALFDEYNAWRKELYNQQVLECRANAAPQ